MSSLGAHVIHLEFRGLAQFPLNPEGKLLQVASGRTPWEERAARSDRCCPWGGVPERIPGVKSWNRDSVSRGEAVTRKRLSPGLVEKAVCVTRRMADAIAAPQDRLGKRAP